MVALRFEAVFVDFSTLVALAVDFGLSSEFNEDVAVRFDDFVVDDDVPFANVLSVTVDDFLSAAFEVDGFDGFAASWVSFGSVFELAWFFSVDGFWSVVDALDDFAFTLTSFIFVGDLSAELAVRFDDEEVLLALFEVIGLLLFDWPLDDFGASEFSLFVDFTVEDFDSSNFDFRDVRSIFEVGDFDSDLDVDAFDLALPRGTDTVATDVGRRLPWFNDADDVGDTDLARSGNLILYTSVFGFLLFLSLPPSSCGMVCGFFDAVVVEEVEAALEKRFLVRWEIGDEMVSTFAAFVFVDFLLSEIDLDTWLIIEIISFWVLEAGLELLEGWMRLRLLLSLTAELLWTDTLRFRFFFLSSTDLTDLSIDWLDPLFSDCSGLFTISDFFPTIELVADFDLLLFSPLSLGSTLLDPFFVVFFSDFALSVDFALSTVFVEMTQRSLAGGRIGTVAKLITNLHWIPIERNRMMKMKTKSFLQMAIFDCICRANDVVIGGKHFKLQFCSLPFNPTVVLNHLMICSKYFWSVWSVKQSGTFEFASFSEETRKL